MKRLSFPCRVCTQVVLGLAVGPSLFASSYTVGFTEAQAVNSYSQARMDAIAQYSWFFAHASVGGNLMTGIESLNSSNPTFFQLTHSPEGDTPPGTTGNGVIFDYDRDNPSWQEKVDNFNTYINNGWKSPKIDFALNKFCFIDQPSTTTEAHDMFVYYRDAMLALESANPVTRFVYATMPLRTDEDTDNYLRNVYNSELRAWAIANNRILFDIADIEAHSPAGVEQTFVYGVTTCQKLYTGYTGDGGHLDTAPGDEIAARGFYAVTGLFVVPEPAHVAGVAGLGLLGAAILRRYCTRSASSGRKA